MSTAETVPGMNKFPKGECWNIIRSVLSTKGTERLLLYGPSGVGKTHTAGKMGLRPNELVLYLTLTPDMPESRILGKWKPRATPQGTELVWSYGIGAQAFLESHKRPVTLVLNEIDHAGMDVVSALHPILDDVDTALITLDNDETISRTSNLRIIATMNGTPDRLIESLRSRFPIAVEIDSVHPDALNILPEDLRQIAARTAVHTDPEQHIDFRKWVEFARLREAQNPELAAKAIIGERWLELFDALKTAGA